MKNLIMFFVLVVVMVFSNYEISYSQEFKTGNFYFLVGTEGNEKAIMYLHIVGERAYGSYYTKNQSIEFSEYDSAFDGRNLKLSYRDNNDRERTITGTLSGDIVFSGKHNSKNVNLSLANTPINSARIIVEDYIQPGGFYYPITEFIFNSRTLDNLGGLMNSIIYLDENIIIYKSGYTIGGRYAGTDYSVYSINTGKNIYIGDFISNLNDRNLLSLLRKKVLEYASNSNNDYYEYNYNDETYYRFDGYSFYITPKGITFYMHDEEVITGENEPHFIDIDFTFEELKPFIKRGSPLDYLFN